MAVMMAASEFAVSSSEPFSRCRKEADLLEGSHYTVDSRIRDHGLVILVVGTAAIASGGM